MASFDLAKTRGMYLARLLSRFNSVTLPIDSTRLALPLQTIFQPMVLHRDPFVPQEQLPEKETTRVKARDGAEALRKSAQGRMVVLGGPGMGKTTALKALLVAAIKRSQADALAPWPLFISLPDLARSGLAWGTTLQQIVTDLELDLRFVSHLLTAIQTGHATPTVRKPGNCSGVNADLADGPK